MIILRSNGCHENPFDNNQKSLSNSIENNAKCLVIQSKLCLDSDLLIRVSYLTFMCDEGCDQCFACQHVQANNFP